MTVGVTGLLIASLFVLFPSSASAAQITNVAVGSMGKGASTAEDGDEAFLVTAQVLIPAGEHIPLDFARVLVSPANTGAIVGNQLNNVICDSVAHGSAVITSIQGDTKSLDKYTGRGYNIDATGDLGYGYDYGYGFDYGGYTDVFSGYTQPGYSAGYGYGYGYANGDITVTVTVKVTGCHDQLKNAPNYKATAQGFEYFRVQVLLGSDATRVIPSFPATAVLANPFATGTGQILADPSGFTIAGGSVEAGQTKTVTLGGVIHEVTIQTSQSIPAGTKLLVEKVANPSGTGAYGVSSLGTQFPGKAAALQFRFQMTDANGNVLSPSGFFTMTVKLDIEKSYFGTGVGETINDFKVFAYDANGNLKGANRHPSVSLLDADKDQGTKWRFTVTITHFSSYAGGATSVAVPSGGGGGGGGGPTTTTTTTQTVTPITQTTTTATETQIVDPTEEAPKDGGKKTPGLELAFVAIALAGAAVIVRRRL